MAGATGAGADVCAALGARVVFNESSSQRWLLCCKAKQATDAVWRPQHDGALLEALRALEALGGLPQGAPAKSDVSWESAEGALKSVKAGLAASWAKPQRGNQHACSPGYDANGCKQARLVLGASRSLRAFSAHAQTLSACFPPALPRCRASAARSCSVLLAQRAGPMRSSLLARRAELAGGKQPKTDCAQRSLWPVGTAAHHNSRCCFH
jgi:hypothetical protein